MECYVCPPNYQALRVLEVIDESTTDVLASSGGSFNKSRVQSVQHNVMLLGISLPTIWKQSSCCNESQSIWIWRFDRWRSKYLQLQQTISSSYPYARRYN